MHGNGPSGRIVLEFWRLEICSLTVLKMNVFVEPGVHRMGRDRLDSHNICHSRDQPQGTHG